MRDKTFPQKYLENREYTVTLYVRENQTTQIYDVTNDTKRDLTLEDANMIHSLLEKGNPREGQLRRFAWDGKEKLWKET